MCSSCAEIIYGQFARNFKIVGVSKKSTWLGRGSAKSPHGLRMPPYIFEANKGPKVRILC